jgi:hypothetical protein
VRSEILTLKSALLTANTALAITPDQSAERWRENEEGEICGEREVREMKGNLEEPVREVAQ